MLNCDSGNLSWLQQHAQTRRTDNGGLVVVHLLRDCIYHVAIEHGSFRL